MSLPTGILVDGVPAQQLSVLDRGLMYGDGVFRTIRVAGGQSRWWPQQYAKLVDDAARLGIPCPDRTAWEADIATLLSGVSEAALKLVLTRGTGARGYRPPEAVTPTRIAILGPLPAWPDAVWRDGVHVRTCELRLSDQPRLAGIKHLNRLENVLARAEWDDPAIHEGLLLDGEGRVVCGVSSNLFVYRGGELLTPRLDHCGIAGVARARVIAAAPGQGLAVRETALRRADLDTAEALFLTNSLIGVWRVARLDDRVLPVHPVEALVRKCLDD